MKEDQSLDMDLYSAVSFTQHFNKRGCGMRICFLVFFAATGTPDPGTLDHVLFGPPGSGYLRYYLCGSGWFNIHAKNQKKYLISTVLRLLISLLSLKIDVKVPEANGT